MLLTVHVAAGALAMVLGAIALSARKGGTVHRRSGRWFVGAMIVMGVTASTLGFLKSPTDGNVFAGFLTLYFVGTALTTVRPPSRWSRAINGVALTAVIVLTIGSIVGGIDNINRGGLSAGGVPNRTIGVMSLILAGAMTLAAIGDARMMRSGPLRGAPRLKRHLWRMCVALFIAAGSFFSIRERVATILPEPFPSGPMRLLPIVLLFGTMFYWLWKLRRKSATPVPVRNDAR
ncbi:MAG TPA: DUF2306 domain-containing protein [Vicinamibacterales bacterium]